VPIRDIQPADVVALQRELREDRVGAAMTQKTLMVLSGIMRHRARLWLSGFGPGEAAGGQSVGLAQASESPVSLSKSPV
jgi:hypothetical protein